MHALIRIVAQASSPPAPLSPEQSEALKSATSGLFVALIVLIVIVVVVMLLLRRHHFTAIRSLRTRHTATELEDLWFENPIERRGEKPPPGSPKDVGNDSAPGEANPPP